MVTREQQLEIKEILRKSQLFWKLTDDQLEKVVALGQGECFSRGEYIAVAGEKGPLLISRRKLTPLEER